MHVVSQGSSKTLEQLGLTNLGNVYWNATTAQLYEQIVRRREGHIGHMGPVIVRTGHHTGRSPHDRFIAMDTVSEGKVWWGDTNRSIPAEKFTALFHRMQAYLQGKDIFVQDCHAGADLEYRIPVRVITEKAWHSIFARNAFRQIHDPGEREAHVPQFTVIDVPEFQAIPELDGTNSEAFILLSFEKKLILIGGTHYAGEMKKSIFTVLNYLLPQENVLSMHCSANVGAEGDSALFFGLSGTGKTTLSADPDRALIGDDEHGWSENGVFNFEGGCYAKVIRLSPENEPDIYETTRRFGTILENVAFDPDSRRVDLDDNALAENTRASYPISHIPGAIREGTGGHPKNVIMLTCDAFGVLPPVSRLTPEQAGYQFISGYTAKVAGTEVGMGNEPTATFSTCFGAPFMALPPTVYSRLLRKKIAKHKTNCWLINTGWTGGPFGIGERMSLPYTRAIIKAALSGKLDNVPYETDPIFGLNVPQACPEVPPEVLNPRQTWADKKAYDEKARELARRFHENFAQFAEDVPDEVKQAGPSAERVSTG
ncbi:MAG: phosphoenolpyruvate carboxykinase (ATP) [FCB group bacterium]|nr:phosphoenolpyruvate carboxykinase (ATP) [FCB group bacterium]